MAYTATITKVWSNDQNERVVIDVDITDGTSTYTKEFSFHYNTDVQTVKKTVQTHIDSLVPGKSLVDVLQVGQSITYTPTTPTPPTKTQAEIDKKTWQQNWLNLQAARKLEAAGVSVLTTAQLNNLVTTVKSTFQNSYVDIV